VPPAGFRAADVGVAEVVVATMSVNVELGIVRSANVPATNATPRRDGEHREAEPDGGARTPRSGDATISGFRRGSP
jgi:hypothetical protein